MAQATPAKKARVNNMELAYIDQGQGRPVVLLHGFPLNNSMWQAQIPALASNFRVIAPDFRGHGESEAPSGTYSMDLLADDVKALLDHLGIDRAVIVGFSMAGYATFAFYRKYPNLVSALVLADTRPQPDSAEAKQGRENTAQGVLKDGVSGPAQALPTRMLTQETQQSRPDLVKAVSGIMASTPVNGYVGDLRGMAERPDSTATLSQITCPTLVIVGEQDTLTPVADSELMAQTIKGATLVKIPGAGHLAPMEAPDAFNKALLDFLAKL